MQTYSSITSSECFYSIFLLATVSSIFTFPLVQTTPTGCKGVFLITWSNLKKQLWQIYVQGCIFRLTCSHSELIKDHVLSSAYIKIFRTVTRNAVNKSVWRKKRLFLTSHINKHVMNIFIKHQPEHSSPRTRARLSENQSAPMLENRKTSPCSPRAPN